MQRDKIPNLCNLSIFLIDIDAAHKAWSVAEREECTPEVHEGVLEDISAAAFLLSSAAQVVLPCYVSQDGPALDQLHVAVNVVRQL